MPVSGSNCCRTRISTITSIFTTIRTWKKMMMSMRMRLMTSINRTRMMMTLRSGTAIVR